MASSWRRGRCSGELSSPSLYTPPRCREILKNSPTALRVLKSALNAAEDGQAGIQQLGGDATLLFYQSEEGNEVGFPLIGTFH